MKSAKSVLLKLHDTLISYFGELFQCFTFLSLCHVNSGFMKNSMIKIPNFGWDMPCYNFIEINRMAGNAPHCMPTFVI